MNKLPYDTDDDSREHQNQVEQQLLEDVAMLLEQLEHMKPPQYLNINKKYLPILNISYRNSISNTHNREREV